MNCSFCGKEIKEGAKFCHFCGTRAPSELPKNIVAATASVTGEESGNVIETAKEFVDAATPQAEPQTTAENLFSAQETAQAESSVEEIAVSDETTAPNAQKIQMDTGITDVQANRKPKSKKKLFVILSAVIVALAVVFSALAICLVQVFADSAPTTPIKAYTYSKGACICYDNGKLININGSLQNAYITPDRERVIYVDKNGKLCWYATDKDTKHDIYDFNSTDTVEIVGICNDMIFFVANSTLYRYSFDEFVFTTVVGSDGLDSAVISSSVYYSGDFGTVAYVRNGGIYVLSEDAFSPNLITHATTTATLKIHDVSCDGELVLWSSYENGIYTLYLWTEDTNGKGDILKQATLAEDDTSLSAGYSLNCPTESSEFVVITSRDTGEMFVKREDHAFTSITLTGARRVGAVYSAKGIPFERCEEVNEKDTFYVCSIGENGNYSLHLVNPVNQKTVNILSDIASFDFADGNIAYTTTAKKAYYVSVDTKNMKLGENKLISEKVSGVYSAEAGGKFVYVTVKADNEQLDLYRYNVKKAVKEKIAANVSDTLHVSEDGKNVYYFANITHNDKNGFSSGTLFVSNAKETKIISSEVIVGSLTSNLVSGEIDPKSIWLHTYLGDTEQSYVYNSVFYNGKEAVAIVKRITK